jgi:hypothetical protein
LVPAPFDQKIHVRVAAFGRVGDRTLTAYSLNYRARLHGKRAIVAVAGHVEPMSRSGELRGRGLGAARGSWG